MIFETSKGDVVGTIESTDDKYGNMVYKAFTYVGIELVTDNTRTYTYENGDGDLSATRLTHDEVLQSAYGYENFDDASEALSGLLG